MIELIKIGVACEPICYSPFDSFHWVPFQVPGVDDYLLEGEDG